MYLLREGGIDWTPSVDIYEFHSGWLVFVELPGLSADDIDLNIYPEAIIIKGVKNPPARELVAEKLEIYTGYFSREIKIPGRISVKDATASMKDGLLSIVLPLEKQNRVRIPVTDREDQERS